MSFIYYFFKWCCQKPVSFSRRSLENFLWNTVRGILHAKYWCFLKRNRSKAKETVQFIPLNLLHKGSTGQCVSRHYVSCKACLKQPACSKLISGAMWKLPAYLTISWWKYQHWILNLTISPATPEKLMELQRETGKRNRISPQTLVHVVIGPSHNSNSSQGTEGEGLKFSSKSPLKFSFLWNHVCNWRVFCCGAGII